jgi:hypothetical protein
LGSKNATLKQRTNKLDIKGIRKIQIMASMFMSHRNDDVDILILWVAEASAGTDLIVE